MIPVNVYIAFIKANSFSLFPLLIFLVLFIFPYRVSNGKSYQTLWTSLIILQQKRLFWSKDSDLPFEMFPAIIKRLKFQVKDSRYVRKGGGEMGEHKFQQHKVNFSLTLISVYFTG